MNCNSRYYGLGISTTTEMNPKTTSKLLELLHMAPKYEASCVQNLHNYLGDHANEGYVTITDIPVEEFEKSMEGIFTTSVSQSTIDESPMVYKPIEEIVTNIADTVEIVKIIKPIYNYKASE